MSIERHQKLLDHIARVGEQTLYEQELLDKLALGRPLRVKFGIDLTAPTLHIGHAVNLWLLRDLQEMGHKVILLLGDFTTRVGDPDGRMDVRPQQAGEQVKRNAEAIIAQTRDILRFDDPALIEVRYNSEWYDTMPLTAFMDLLRNVTHSTLIARATFQKRIAAKRDIFAHEMLYPVLQGYDSVMIDADLTVVGADQRYNEMIGRQLQEAYGKQPQTIVTTRISAGTDGELKQSKSLGNYVGLAQEAHDKFMRLMGIPDHLVELYLRLYTDVPLDTIALWAEEVRRNPRLIKMKMAYATVGRYHGHDAAHREMELYDTMMSHRERLGDMPVVLVFHARITVLEMVMAARPKLGSKACRQLIENGQISLNGEKFLSPDSHILISDDDVLSIGGDELSRLIVLHANEFASERLLMRPMRVEDIGQIFNILPLWEIVKYLGLPKAPESEAVAREVMQRVIAKPEPKDEWIWTVARRDAPHQIMGVAHLSKQGGQGIENIWLNQAYHTGGFAEEVLDAVNEYAFNNAGVNNMMFKSAFSFAAAPQEMEVLRRRFSNMDAQARNREDPEGTWGFTKEGWQLMKQQIRQVTPEVKSLMNESVAYKVKKEKVRKSKSGFVAPDASKDAPTPQQAQQPPKSEPPQGPRGPKPAGSA